MQDKISKPIFIVGSPRSGTSILTWCLGQHPNMLALPESSWMGDFAINLAISHKIGTARGNRSVLSGLDIQSAEFFAAFGETINYLILNHRKDLERKRGGPPASGLLSVLKKTASESEAKARWVDGTPEYSFYICGLRKLFPKARFIHLVRDVSSVVRSMLNFHRVSGIHLVANEQEAYNYWLRTVGECLQAERAYGPDIVRRVRYSDFTNRPESTTRSLLDFLGEPYAQQCLEPLAQRINSSNVPADFKADDSATDPTVVEKAQRLSLELEKNPQPADAMPAAADEMEAAFEERVQYFGSIDSTYQRAKQMIRTLQNSGLPLYAVTEALFAITDLFVDLLSQFS